MPNRGVASGYPPHSLAVRTECNISGGSSSSGSGSGDAAACLDAAAKALHEEGERPPRHPARLVGDAIDMLGVAQDGIRGKACRRVIRKARGALIAMLDGTGPCHASGCGGRRKACGKRGRKK